MRIRKNIIVIYVLLSTLLLSIIGFSNPSKTSINLFTWKSKEISVGELIALTFIGGFMFSTLFTLNNLSQRKKDQVNEFIDDKKDLYDVDQEDYDSPLDEENLNERPPERDINDSQPTISVNYRVINPNEKKFSKSQVERDTRVYVNNDDWQDEQLEW